VRSWDDYREVSRAGRGTALGAKQRRELWQVFEFALEKLEERNHLTFDTLCHRVAAELQRRGEQPFRHVVVDECQDFGIPELALIRALAPEGPDDLYFCGDMAQQIYKIPFSWASVGLAIRGRSTRLKVNYRTTEQIRRFADGLLPSEIRSRDDDDESRDAISLMRGPDPRVTPCPGVDAEVDTVAAWLRDVRDAGIDPDEIAIFARSKKVLRQRGESAARKAGLDSVLLAEEADGRPGCVSLGTMHRAKGLEYRAVAVVGVDDGLVPLKAALRDAIDDVDREAVREQERQLLYVAMTRAREELLVTSGGEVSEFLVSTTPH
jgi:superfamily I DNA/RNA helicase